MNFLFIATSGTTFDLPLYIDSTEHSVYSLDEVKYNPSSLSDSPSFERVEEEVSSGKYDFVLTYLFHPIISDICEMFGIRYISIIYDSPQIGLFHGAIFNSINRIFVFDKALYNRLTFIGVDTEHVFHMPLFANTDRTDRLIFTDEDAIKYGHDISFAGSLYENNMYNNHKYKLPAEIIMPSNEYLAKNLGRWNQIREWPSVNKSALSYLKKFNLFSHSNASEFEFPEELYVGNLLLSRKLAELERRAILKVLSDKFCVDLYTSSKCEDIGSTTVHPYINYYTEIGKLYKYSKINLNLTIPSIETGVPLRIFDILAYGGFVLTSYTSELDELFDVGKDLVAFKSIDECVALCDYYLNHPEERQQIAENGYKKVHEKYTCKEALEFILDKC